MAHRYGQEIQVATGPRAKARAGGRQAGADHLPQAFGWQQTVYRVVEVLGRWHLRDRWWLTDGSAALAEPASGLGTLGASDRRYYRVRCVPALLCEIYHDAVTGAWVLDRVCD